jgi:hypothetical protein
MPAGMSVTLKPHPLACQFQAARAPNFQRAVLQLQGISQNHRRFKTTNSFTELANGVGTFIYIIAVALCGHAWKETAPPVVPHPSPPRAPN